MVSCLKPKLKCLDGRGGEVVEKEKLKTEITRTNYLYVLWAEGSLEYFKLFMYVSKNAENPTTILKIE